ncbi:MAG: DNA translocase FtsK [Eubacteriaceae bacterium]|jgi:S-DNA-T family DNA segregation ATPase FtsK/SpoIIIE|nr:DNA translocase FtsK [Eubacteriaceae bacterium]
MAQSVGKAKRKGSRRPSAKERRRREDLKTEIKGFCFLFSGLYLLLCIALPSPGALGAFFGSFSLHLAGTGGRYVIALALILEGAFLLAKLETFTKEHGSFYTAIMSANALAILGLGAYRDFSHYSYFDPAFYQAMWDGPAPGGFAGQIAAQALADLLGGLGAALVVCLVSVVSFIMIFRKSIVELAHGKEKAESSAKAAAPARRQSAKAAVPKASEIALLKAPRDPLGTSDQDAAQKRRNAVRIIGREEASEAAALPAAQALDLASAEEADSGRQDYAMPPLTLLDQEKEPASVAKRQQEVLANVTLLEKALANFGIEAGVSEVSVGPAVTRYELQLKPGIRVSKVISLSDDIAMSLAAQRVRIEAPIPGKSAIGIEVPNKEISIVRLSQILSTEEFRAHPSPLAVAMGKDLAGGDMVVDVTAMPHLLIAGATGSGKSVCINTIIMSILFHSAPEDVRMILIDPKMVELNVYNDIPHLLIPVVTDAKDAAGALGWAVREMTRRYEMFSEAKVRSISSYNAKMKEKGEGKLAHILLIIDELNDLMLVSAQQVEASIIRLSQLARAAGIHLVLATQRPSVNVITGVIKANIPSRISFAVMSQVDSRTILDMGGAERLLGKGDMLYLPQERNAPVRAQCAFVADKEIERVVGFIKRKQSAKYDESVMEGIKRQPGESDAMEAGGPSFKDELLPKAMEIAFEKNAISTSTIQRRLRLGYARAGRIIDEMEMLGYISSADGSKPRKVLVAREDYYGGAK